MKINYDTSYTDEALKMYLQLFFPFSVCFPKFDLGDLMDFGAKSSSGPHKFKKW